MIELTERQRQAVRNGEAVRVDAPELGEEVVLMSATQYQTIRELLDDKREQVVFEIATCLTNSRWVAKGLWDRAVGTLGHEGITDVVCLMGFYTSVSMTLACYDVPAGATGMAR